MPLVDLNGKSYKVVQSPNEFIVAVDGAFGAYRGHYKEMFSQHSLAIVKGIRGGQRTFFARAPYTNIFFEEDELYAEHSIDVFRHYGREEEYATLMRSINCKLSNFVFNDQRHEIKLNLVRTLLHAIENDEAEERFEQLHDAIINHPEFFEVKR